MSLPTLFSRALYTHYLGGGWGAGACQGAGKQRDLTLGVVKINSNKLDRLPGLDRIAQIKCNTYYHPFQMPGSGLLKTCYIY